MNIRNMSDTLLKRIKSEAALAGKTLREYVIGRLESGDHRAEGVPGLAKNGEDAGRQSHGARRVRAAGDAVEESIARSGQGIEVRTVAGDPGLPNPKVCVNCDHQKGKHGGFKGACQVENCMCGGFE